MRSLQFSDRAPFQGVLQLIGRDADTNKVLYFFKDHNVVTYAGRKVVNFSVAGDRPLATFKHIAVGTGAYLPNPISLTVPPPDAAETDTALKTETLRKAVYLPINHTTELSSVLEIELGSTECVGQKLNEFGLFLSDGTLFARRTTIPVTKIERMILTITWTVLF